MEVCAESSQILRYKLGKLHFPKPNNLNISIYTITTFKSTSKKPTTMPSYLVTGASRGLGYAFVRHLAAVPGNTVIGMVRNKEATLARLEKDGIVNVAIVEADITDREALTAAYAEVTNINKGSLDVLINNAGLVSERSAFKTLVDDELTDLENDLMASFRANVVGVANTVNAFLPLLRAGHGKKIITISTGMADTDLINRFSIPIAAPYSISKAATNALVAKFNAALGKSENMLVMALSPGLVDTSEGKPMTEQELQGAQAMGAMFQDYAPNFKGPVTAEQSVEMCLKVIEGATVQTHGGAFVSHLGNRQWL
jgi:NAD(P)-dependent dehydrogenase (short-subunit alcohol dehydrogenase family)